MLRPWNFVIKLDTESATPLYIQLVQLVAEEIKQGRLKPLDALPGTRELAANLKVNRKTVILAYDELIAQGWLQTEKRRGTFVAPTPPISAITRVINEATFEEANHNAFNIEINDGIPDSRLIPFEIISRSFRQALLATSRASRLGYANPLGTIELRTAIANMLNMERGLHVTSDNICLVRGSQMGIYISSKVLLQAGDTVVMERLSYEPARLAFLSCGAEIIQVDHDDKHGINLDELENICRKRSVKFVYVTPHHQFPTTVMMSDDKRRNLLALSDKYGFKILEDDYDHEFHYKQIHMLPLASHNRENVIYIGSLSKVLAPGLRVGYLVGSSSFIHDCAKHIMIIDRQGNPVTELAAATLMKSGELKRHILKTKLVYETRRNNLTIALNNHFHDYFSFESPEGGLAFWLKFAPGSDLIRFLANSTKNGLHFSPGSVFPDAYINQHAIRLGFGSLDDRQQNRMLDLLLHAMQSS